MLIADTGASCRFVYDFILRRLPFGVAQSALERILQPITENILDLLAQVAVLQLRLAHRPLTRAFLQHDLNSVQSLEQHTFLSKFASFSASIQNKCFS